MPAPTERPDPQEPRPDREADAEAPDAGAPDAEAPEAAGRRAEGREGPLEDVARPSADDQRVEALMAHTIDVPVLASAVERQAAADAADTLEQLDEEDAADILEQMGIEAAAEAVAEMETPLAIRVIEDVVEEDAGFAARLLDVMAPDDAADLLQALSTRQSEAVLAAMPAAEARHLRRLVGYDEESAGGLMTTEYLALRSAMSVAEAIQLIREEQIPEGMQQLPVTSGDGTLVGMIGLRELLLAKADQSIGDVMSRSVPVVRVGVDREEVAQEFDRYDWSLLFVVNDRDRLLGVITVDDVIDTIRAEQTEDVQMTVGAGAGEAVYSGLLEKLKGRFPWLAVSLLITCVAAGVVLAFEELIRDNPVLAYLMPVIAALVGNAGHQALAVTLRGIVLDQVRRERVGPLIARELVVGLLAGLALGLLLAAVISLLPSGGWHIGLVAGASTAAAMSVGTLAGSSVPLLMRRVGIDPAHSSAIFMIVITDGVSFSCLLGLAFLVLKG